MFFYQNLEAGAADEKITALQKQHEWINMSKSRKFLFPRQCKDILFIYRLLVRKSQK
jgi:hypothetical protein